MILSNTAQKRARFFSPIESLPAATMLGHDINENMTIVVRDLKGFLSYLAAVHTREPVFVQSLDMVSLDMVAADEVLGYNEFIETTLLNSEPSFYFQATTFVNKVPLNFTDRSLLGDKNTYKPFDSSDIKAVNSMLTETIEGIRQFSDKTFKLRTYRGLVAFNRVSIHKRGYTIDLIDRKLTLTIIASKHSSSSNSYIGILYSREP